MSGCGKKAPPLPPIVLYPALIRDLTVRQEGTKFILYFTPPIANNDGSPLMDLDRIEVYRIAEDRPPPPAPQSQPAAQSQPGQTQPSTPPAPPAPPPVIPPVEVTVLDFAGRAGLIHTIEAPELDQYRNGNYLTFTDDLANFQPPRGLKERFTYAVQPFSIKDRGPGFSNRITLDLIPLADPPADAKALVQETGVVLSWTAPRTNIDGTTPPAIVGYNVYRKMADEKVYSAEPLNGVPYPIPPYIDGSAAFGTKYQYIVKGVNTANRPYQETARSNEVEVQPSDAFPPPSPQNLVAVAAKSGINLLWSATQAKDFAGYRVYRRTEKGSLELLTPTPVSKNTYLDSTVKSKTVYYYVVTSIDQSTPPNESAHSNEAKELMP